MLKKSGFRRQGKGGAVHGGGAFFYFAAEKQNLDIDRMEKML